MKFLAISCVAVLCLAHSSDCEEKVRTNDPRNLTSLTNVPNEFEEVDPKASFVGGGVMQDSCRGEVKFTSELNHLSGFLTWLYYRVTLADGTEATLTNLSLITVS